ncbi:MAG: hypothetical protein QM642_09700 [Edaphocola sp.]
MHFICQMPTFAPMKRKNIVFVAGACLLFLAACQNGHKGALVGKWQATKLTMPQRDSMMQIQLKEELARIDTLGTVDTTMAKRYGTTDLNDFKTKAKAEINKQFEDSKGQMKKAAEDFKFELKSNGEAILINPNGTDTLNWYTADDGKKLFLDPFDRKSGNPAGPGQVLTFDIVHASGDSLRLRVHQPIGQDVFVDLRPAKEDDAKKDAGKNAAEKK